MRFLWLSSLSLSYCVLVCTSPVAVRLQYSAPSPRSPHSVKGGGGETSSWGWTKPRSLHIYPTLLHVVLHTTPIKTRNGPLLLSCCMQIRPALYSPLLRIPVMASSKGSIWPLTHAASNASSPSAPRAAATVRSC